MGDPDRVAIVPGALEGAKQLADAGFLLIVTSNQSGIARGMMTEAQADAVDAKISSEFSTAGARIEAFYRCPHLPTGTVARYARDCDCRKPKPGMLRRAAKDHHIDLSRSWSVGDRSRDIAAGIAAGCRTVAVRPQEAAAAVHGASSEALDAGEPAYRARDLLDAARYIIEHS